MSNITPKENTALDIAMTRLGELVDRMEKASHPYPRERTWSDCEAEIERLRTRVKWFEGAGGVAMATNIYQLLAEIERLRDARRELLVAIHALASHFENALYAFRDDDEARKKAEGDIAFAMQIASRHNYNGDQQ